jgi:Tfp pilus assembly pilus retraction ATPase PilT
MQTGKNQGMQTMNDALMDLVKAKKVEAKEAFMKSIHKAEMKKSLEAAGYRVDLQAE